MDLRSATLYHAHLEGADLRGARLEGADLNDAHLEGADLSRSHLEEALLTNAKLKGARLRGAHLEGAELDRARLEGAHLMEAHLEGAQLKGAHLEGASLSGAHLAGADLRFAHLEGTDFQKSALVEAWLFDCKVDHKTDFRNSNLDSALCDFKTKNRLKYNIRRLNWEDWYKDHPGISWLIKWFWGLTDYGTNQKNLIWAFLKTATLFAAIFWLFPGIVSGLSAEDPGNNSDLLMAVRAMYFSVVTMTTLGFEDIYAAPGSY